MNSGGSTDVAIIGMSALFAGAPDLSTYWQNILSKVDAISEAPPQWFGSQYDPTSHENDRIYTKKGGFLGDLATFNPLEFGIMPNAVDGGGPAQYLALKMARQALVDAGYGDRPFNREKTGVIWGYGTYVNRAYTSLMQHGTVVDQTLDILRQLLPQLQEETLAQVRQGLKDCLPPFNPEICPGLIPNNVAGRVANRLDLMGPNYVIDAACASSLISVELGIKDLLSGRCDMLLAGGINASVPPTICMVFTQLGALSRTTIRPFDAAADGTLMGEGCGVMVLKRLADAERDGDRIYAVVKGVGCASDGKALSSIAPRLEGEILALRRAYEEHDIDPATIGLIEAHGTSIPKGDQTEVQSLTHIFGHRQGEFPPIAMGSVKSMIGHCIPASGAAGLVKAALSLYHQVLPPTLCTEVNPDLKLEETPFYINNEARPWIHPATGVPRRAAVNAFGFGGINSHAILEEYRGPAPQQKQQLHRQWPSELLILAAETRELLVESIHRLQQYVTAHPQASLADIAFTLSAQAQGSYRLAIQANDLPDLGKKLASISDKLADPQRTSLKTRSGIFYGQTPLAGQIAFLFPGEGGQYPNMLMDLCLYFPEVRQWFDLLEEAFASQRDLKPSSVIFPAPTCLSTATRQQAEQRLMGMEIGIPALFVASMALYDLLVACGVPCHAMLGHSSGENTALTAAKSVVYEDRSQLLEKMKQFNHILSELENGDQVLTGVLLAVGGLDADTLQERIAREQGEVLLAMDNCSNQVILFGSETRMQSLQQELQEQGAICMRLPFNRAYHTPHFAEVSRALRQFYGSFTVQTGETPLYSCATADRFPADAEAMRDLVADQWSSPVRFRDTITHLYEQGYRLFVEVGPSSNLTAFVENILRDKPEGVALASNSRHKPGLVQLHQLLGQLFAQGVEITLAPCFQHRSLQQLDLESTAVEVAATPNPAHILARHIPIMRLQPELVQTIRAKLSDPQTAEGTTPLDSSPLPTASLIAAPHPQAVPAIQAAGFAPPPPPQAVGVSAAPAPMSSASTVSHSSQGMASYFNLMQEFLASQARVFADLHSQSGIPPHDSNGSEGYGSTSYGSEAYGPTSTFAEQWPLLGQVIQQDGQTLVCERHVQVTEDIYLYDHTFGSQPSQYQLELTSLPVIPLTFSMEMIAEAACYLTGGQLRVVSLHNLRAHRWIALDHAEVDLRLVAQLQPAPDQVTQSVYVHLYQVDQSDPANMLLVFEGEVRLADQYATPPEPFALRMDPPLQPQLRDDELYRTCMFHGPRLQGITHLRQWSPNAIEGDMLVLPTDNFFRHTRHPVFQLDAGLLDAVGQLVGYWISEQFGPADSLVFPFHVEALYQYCDPLPAGTWLLGRGTVQFMNENQIEAHFDVVDQTGRVVLRIVGWKDIRYKVPHSNFYLCRIRPQTEYLTEPYYQEQTQSLLRRIPPFPKNFLDSSSAIWKRTLAHHMLNQAEREQWYSLPETGPRRTDWLLGRIAAKDAVRQWAEQVLGLQLAPVDIEICTTDLGKPYAYCPLLGDMPLPDLSISHSQGYVVATLALQEQVRIGIDLERRDRQRSDTLLQGAFTPEELALLEPLPEEGEARQLLTLGLWCAKEAAAKTAGVGLGGRPRDWRISSCSPEANKMTVSYGVYTFPVQLWYTQEEVMAVCQVDSSVTPANPTVTL